MMKNKPAIVDKRKAIIEAVIQIIGEKGVPGVTHRAVAKRARVSLASTTYYFKTLDDIIEAAFVFLMKEGTDKFKLMIEKLKTSTTEHEAVFIKHMQGLFSNKAIDTIKFIANIELFLENVRTNKYTRLIAKYTRAYNDFLLLVLKKEHQNPYSIFVVQSLILGIAFSKISTPPKKFWSEIFMPFIIQYFDLKGNDK